MGFFGGKSKKQNSGRGASRSRSKKKEPLTAEQVQEHILSAMVEFGNGMKFEKWSAVAGQSFTSIGFDELDAAEVCLTVEDLCAVRLSEGVEYKSPNALFAFMCEKLSIEVQQSAVQKPAAYEKDILSKLNGASHLLKCGHCGKGLRRKSLARCGVHEFNCPSCEAKQYDLGPLPIPDADMPMGGIVSPIDVPQGKSGEVIKWFCSWCGCTVGSAQKCSRCSCDLSLVPPQYGAVFVAGGEGLEENLYVQATTPMSVSVALVRLGRASVKSALKTGATKEYAQTMQPEEAPPTALTKD